MQGFYEFPFGDLTGVVISPNSLISTVDLQIILPIVRLFLGNDTLKVDLCKNANKDTSNYEEYIISNKKEKADIFFCTSCFYIAYNKRTYLYDYKFNNDNIKYTLTEYHVGELTKEIMISKANDPYEDAFNRFINML